ncbi:unnamed protein product [Bursaphelenchus xylophilus]|uniref:(pine wood nematode) hypothetical protein n=1 Tax=Bursaphelenchus xylophilus TaxID=6326 RepID=A0A1I7S4N0_BURXY|nr:unnamed protein product [Bursaphelenchus xylophilus]CAG9117247.1 unnamed protein product [Bursaphelenchus xylophilus]
MADRQILLKSLEFMPLTRDGEKQGVEIYKYSFANMPAMMPFYHLADGFTADSTITSDRFQKLGCKLALATHILANLADQPETLKAYAREHVLRHISRKVSPRMFRGFFDILVDWMATKTTISEEARREWAKLGDLFSYEAVKYADELGLVFPENGEAA